MNQIDSNKSATALRALKVLEVLGQSPRPVAVAAVADALGSDRSTAYRMLMTLVEAGYVVRDEQNRNYQLGYRLLSLTKSLLEGDERSDLITRALREIAEKTRETVHYSVLDQDAVVLLFKARGTQLVTVDFKVGDRSPLHCTSIGKAMLAFQDTRLVESVIAAGLPKVAPNTITEPDVFRAALAKIRMEGVAYDDLEFAEDMRCVAVPVFEKGHLVRGGISLSGPTSRYSYDKLSELGGIAMQAARQLSEQLGGSPQPAISVGSPASKLGAV